MVTTSMTNHTDSIIHVSAKQCAKSLIADLGVISISYGHIFHRIQGYLAEMVSPSVSNFVMSFSMKQFRKEYLAKAAQK
jgi:hypothetical protein